MARKPQSLLWNSCQFPKCLTWWEEEAPDLVPSSCSWHLFMAAPIAALWAQWGLWGHAAHGSQWGTGSMLGRSSEGVMPMGLLWSSGLLKKHRPCHSPWALNSLLKYFASSLLLNIFCCLIIFQKQYFFLKFFDSSSLIARQQLGRRTARSPGSTALPSFLTQTLPTATAVAASFQPRGGCTEAIGEVILIYIFNSLKCLEACKRHYINQLITVSEVSQPIRIQFSLMRDK